MVTLDFGELVIIQAGAAQALVIPHKTERFNQMQAIAGVGTQADDVAGIRRNFRLVQNNIQHDSGMSAWARRPADKRMSSRIPDCGDGVQPAAL